MRPGVPGGQTDRYAVIGVIALGVASASLLAGACHKEKESLVELSLTADLRASDAHMVVLVAGNVAQTFSAPAGLSPTPTFFGVYVPGSVIGTVALNADATPDSGCLAYHGTGSVTITTPGETVRAEIALRPVNRCADGGNGDDAGQGGMTGSGAGGMIVLGTGGGGLGGSGGGLGGNGVGGNGVGGNGVGGNGQGGAASGGRSGAGGRIVVPGAPTFDGCTEINHAETAACSSSCSSGDSIVYGAAFSPDGQTAVTGGSDGRVKVWRVSGQTLTPEGHVLTGTGFGVLAFSPTGNLLAVGRAGGIDLYDPTTWIRLRTLTVASKVFGLGFIPDGTKIVSVDKDTTLTTLNSTLYVHSVGLLPALASVKLDYAFSLAVSPITTGVNTPVAVTTTNGNMLVYNVTNSGMFGPPTMVTVTSDGSYAETAEFSKQGTLLAAGGDDGVLHMWTVSTLAASAPDINFSSDLSGYSTYVAALAFTPTGNFVAIGGGYFGALGAWATTAPRAQVSGPFSGQHWDFASLAFSPDGRLLIGGESACGCVLVCPQ